MIKIKELKKVYGDRTVLDIDCLEIKKGETVVIVGPNGSGKSTLLKILSGVIKQTSGDFSSEGEVYYLPQQSVPFGKTVKKNILFCVKDKTDAEKRTEDILALFNLKNLSDKNAKSLSGGECQRLSLARILVNKADIILLDEPTSAADIEGTEIIENALREYKNRTDCTILITTHSPRQAMALADRIVMLKDGKIVESGSARELLQNPRTDWGKKFIDSWKLDI